MLTSELTVHMLKLGHVCCPVIQDSSFFHSFIHLWSTARYYRPQSRFRFSKHTWDALERGSLSNFIEYWHLYDKQEATKHIFTRLKIVKKNDACSAGYFIFSFHFQFNRIYFTLEIFAFDVRRTQHIILVFLWYSAGNPVVIRVTFSASVFRRTSTFSAPS